MSGYEVEHVKYGVLVRGTVPADEFGALARLWADRGLTQMVLGVASALGASFAVARPKDVEPWLTAARKEAASAARGDAELEWLKGPDTGTSSRSIFAVLSKKHGHLAFVGHGFGPSEPLDPDDFGRCHRLLQAIPEWRGRLAEVAAAYPGWGPLIREWDRCTALYEQEEPTGRAPKLYALMQELRREGGLLP